MFPNKSNESSDMRKATRKGFSEDYNTLTYYLEIPQNLR